jgi:hypothetical protein
MSSPEEIDHCPISPECAAKRLYRINGTLYKFNLSLHKLEPHVCTTAGTESRLPVVVYTGEWLNERTKRTRYHGPFRAKASAEKPPAEGGSSKRRRQSEWTLVQIHYDRPDWKVLED